jgi:phosphoglycolate phosphatase
MNYDNRFVTARAGVFFRLKSKQALFHRRRNPPVDVWSHLFVSWLLKQQFECARMINTTAIKAILFDKDGTLIDFEATWGPVNQKAGLLAAQGDRELACLILDRCGVDPVTGKTRAESPLAIAAADEIAGAMIAAGSHLTKTDLVQGLHALFAEAARTAVPLADLPVLFSQLKSTCIKIGIASSDSAEAVAATITTLGLETMVDFHCGYDSGFGPKPEPGMIFGFCSALGLEPNQIAMVGDSTHDLGMGRAAHAGLSIGVLSGTGSRESLAPLADVLIASIADLPALLAVKHP